MSAFTKRNHEVARIVAILESDEFDTEQQMAFAVLKEAVEIVTARDMWAVWTDAHRDILFGPYWTIAQAEGAWNSEMGPELGTDHRAILAPIFPWRDKPLPEPNAGRTEKCHCGHPAWWHTNSGKRSYCGPRSAGCKCPGFTRPS